MLTILTVGLLVGSGAALVVQRRRWSPSRFARIAASWFLVAVGVGWSIAAFGESGDSLGPALGLGGALLTYVVVFAPRAAAGILIGAYVIGAVVLVVATATAPSGDGALGSGVGLLGLTVALVLYSPALLVAALLLRADRRREPPEDA